MTHEEILQDFESRFGKELRIWLDKTLTTYRAQVLEEERSRTLTEIDRLGNFWTNNGRWKVPTVEEQAADSFKAFKFGKVELLSDLKNFIEHPTK